MAEKTNETLRIVVDDGRKRIPIENMSGDEVGVFYFNPTDMGIIARFNETVSTLDDIVEPLQNIDINADGTTDVRNAEMMAALQDAESRLYSACDYIFGGNMSEAFFGKINPFSPIGGVFYFENALEQLGAFISDQFGKETQKVNKRVTKYAKKYTRGNTK